MAKLYSENSITNNNDLEPKDETINFILNYSKAYKVINGKSEKYDMLLN
ncbi:hypothetical protein MHTCC0001_04140 [Flavobacteriaceae bacterium MHTCC 0001]